MASNYTPQQITEILEEFFNVVGCRQYIGARYIPIFGRKGETSVTWDNTASYEPLTIVIYQGNSFTSRTYVPAGADINDTTYWIETGNYNAQIEAYRDEVLTFDGRITSVEDGISDLTETVEDTTETLTDSIDDLSDDVTTIRNTLNSFKLNELKGHMWSGQKSIGFGDSNMYGTQDGPDAITYKKLCTQLGCSYDNRGVGGAQFDMAHHPNCVMDQIDNATYDADVRLVVFIGGINDFHYSNRTVTQYYNVFNQTVAAAIEKFPNATICAMFDHGQQFPNAKMLRWPRFMQYAMGRLGSRRGVFVPTGDMPMLYKMENADLYVNQNHFSNNGTTFLALRAAALLTGGNPLYHTGRCWGTALTGLSGMGIRHFCKFDPNACAYEHDYFINSSTPSYTVDGVAQDSIPSFSVIDTVYGGFSTENSSLGAPGFAINHTYTNNSGVGTLYTLQLDQTEDNYTSREAVDSVIRLRNRQTLPLANINGRNGIQVHVPQYPYE